MQSARYGEPPPRELKLAWDCERWGTLPDSGALFDQNYALMLRMSVLGNIFQTVLRLKNLKGHAIHSLTTSERRLLRYVQDSGISVFG